MQLLSDKVYLGPNRWSRIPTIELYFRFDAASPSPARLSSIIHRLHRMSGVIARSFEPMPISSNSDFLLAHEFEEKALIDECVRLAIRICEEGPGDLERATAPYYRQLVDLADDVRLGPSSRAILQAATVRGIPYFRMNQGSLLQFGEGAYQRRTWTAETDATPAIAEAIAADKHLTRSLLKSVGVNVPHGRSVHSGDDAWQAALEVGLPVAVKPRNANHAVGVSLDLRGRQEVIDAYHWACKAGHTTEVLVEQFIEGDHHRLLIIDGKMQAAAKGQREYVYGNGSSTIRQLVDQLNTDPRRGENYTDQLQVVKLDDNAAIQLRKQNLDFDSVPEFGRQVLVWHVGDLIEDCTDAVHPTTQDVAILAAKVVGLDIAGVDLVVKDISQPLGPQRGCIIEVNAGPSLTPHIRPVFGLPRPVGEAIVELLYPNHSPSKIPTVLILDNSEISGYSDLLADALQQEGISVGIASESAEITSSWPIRRPLAEYRSLLMHPMLTAAVIEATPTTLADRGLLCGHVDYVILGPSILFDSTDKETMDSLNMVSHLLELGGQVLVLGDCQKGECERNNQLTSTRLRIEPNRMEWIPSRCELTSLLCRRIKSSVANSERLVRP